MFILEYGERRSRRGIDPVIEVARSQFESLVDELRSSLDRPETTGGHQWHDLADHLCEASREWLFNLHRVTPQDLQDVAGCFGQAVQLMQRIQISDKDLQGDVVGYTQHITNRIVLIEKYLQGRGLTVPADIEPLAKA